MHRLLSGKFQLIPTSRHLLLCKHIPGNQKGRQAALPGLSAGPNANGSGWLRTALGPEPDLGAPIEFFKLRVASAARRQRPASTTTIVLGAPTALVSAAALGLAATLVLAWASG